MKREVIKLTIAVDNKILEFASIIEPKIGNIVETSKGRVKLTDVKFMYEYSDAEKIIKHFACCGNFEEENMVGVRQVKFIQGNSYDDMEKNLNKFLNETKFTHTIEDITHTMAYVCITYRLKNEQDIWVAKNHLKSYQEK